ncbi:uncharacterized protein J3D65DRAFT_183121 [Phyllosticta citribraziliensis]|uniref:Uncharacterized protein n=1 Tax=Phyllosticta citribraziliensis TaxID=989973 RepID=A0ABR1L349_9PEZI
MQVCECRGASHFPHAVWRLQCWSVISQPRRRRAWQGIGPLPGTSQQGASDGDRGQCAREQPLEEQRRVWSMTCWMGVDEVIECGDGTWSPGNRPARIWGTSGGPQRRARRETNDCSVYRRRAEVVQGIRDDVEENFPPDRGIPVAAGNQDGPTFVLIQRRFTSTELYRLPPCPSNRCATPGSLKPVSKELGQLPLTSNNVHQDTRGRGARPRPRRRGATTDSAAIKPYLTVGTIREPLCPDGTGRTSHSSLVSGQPRCPGASKLRLQSVVVEKLLPLQRFENAMPALA